MRALTTAARPTPIAFGTGQRIEVLLERQLALLERGSHVVLTVPVSTGKGVNATPPGSFMVFRKEIKSWSYPFQEWLPWALLRRRDRIPRVPGCPDPGRVARLRPRAAVLVAAALPVRADRHVGTCAHALALSGSVAEPQTCVLGGRSTGYSEG